MKERNGKGNKGKEWGYKKGIRVPVVRKGKERKEMGMESNGGGKTALRRLITRKRKQIDTQTCIQTHKHKDRQTHNKHKTTFCLHAESRMGRNKKREERKHH